MERPAKDAPGPDETAQRRPVTVDLRLLVLCEGAVTKHALPIEGGRVTLGRSGQNSVVIEHATVSRSHAVLHIEPGPRIRIEDLRGSRAGVRIRKLAIPPGEPVEVTAGDAFELGDVLCLIEGPPSPSGGRAGPQSTPSGTIAAVRDELQALERARILEALEATGNNRTRAAERLGIPRRTLTKRLAEYGLTRKRAPKGAGSDGAVEGDGDEGDDESDG